MKNKSKYRVWIAMEWLQEKVFIPKLISRSKAKETKEKYFDNEEECQQYCHLLNRGL